MTRFYRLNIQLLDTDIVISRCIEVPATLSLNQLHPVIQAVMGWQNTHLYLFEHGQQIWTHPSDQERFLDDDNDVEQQLDTEAVLCQVLQCLGDSLRYVYDFGDDWQHEVTLVAIEQRELDLQQVVTLLSANGACPPEDVGGVSGYVQMVAAFTQQAGKAFADYQGWLGCDHWDATDAKAAELALRVQHLNQHLAEMQRARWLTWTLNPTADVHQMPIMQLLAPMLTVLYAGPLKLTATGNLPLRLVDAMFAIEQQLPSWQRLRFKKRKMSSEQDSALICFSRHLAQKAGLVKVTANKLQLTKTGEKLLLSQNQLKMYQKLLQAALDKFSWVELDGYQDFHFLQLGFMPILDYLQQQEKSAIGSELLFDKLQAWFPECDTEAYADHLDDAVETRIQWIGELFGLCDVQELPAHKLDGWQRQFIIQLTEPAKAMLCFSTAAANRNIDAE